MEFALPTGAVFRVRGAAGAPDVALFLPGGFPRPPEARWGATTHLLARRVARALPGVRTVELRFRWASWSTVEACFVDTAEMLDRLADDGATRVLLVGFSMGGAVAGHAAAHPLVAGVVGVAPWLPATAPIENLRGRTLRAYHGGFDTDRFGLPGVPASESRAAVARARLLGIDAEHHTLPGAFHGAALGVGQVLMPLPRAAAWTRAVTGEIARFHRPDGANS